MVLLKGSQLQIRTPSNHLITGFELLLCFCQCWLCKFQRRYVLTLNAVNAFALMYWYSIENWLFLYSKQSCLSYLFSVSSIYWSLSLSIKPWQTPLEPKARPDFCISVYSATLQACLQSCSQPWRVLFLQRQSGLRHLKSHKVHDSWAEALWTQNEDDWIWGGMWSYCAIVFVNPDVFTLWGLCAYPRNSKRKKDHAGFSSFPCKAITA